MKKTQIRLAVLLLCLLTFGCSTAEQPAEDEPDDYLTQDISAQPMPLPEDNQDSIYETIEMTGEGFRAVWVATVLNLDFPSRQDLNAAAMKREIDEIVSRSAELGLNAIIFQVRPTGDSFYESDIFPWSHWLSGTQGQGIPDFDPLLYWIDACHANGIELHAWLNPYRIIHTSMNSSDPNTLSVDNPVRQHPELAVGWSHANGNKGLFLDPGQPAARQLIIDGIYELATKYDVDGIHMDDYFYPGTDFDDSVSFELYGNGMDLDDWRRDNVNTLIKDIKSTIQWVNLEQGKKIRWGVSPSAIWKNDSTDPLGKPVPSTFESYHLAYADTRLWVTSEWIDYICPQIYWYIGFPTADFEVILDWWVDLCKDYDVDLYVGHAAYREDENDQPPNWQGEMLRQLEMTESSDVVTGNVFYRFHSLRGELGDTIRPLFADDEAAPHLPVMILDTLSVGMPAQDTTITGTASSAPGYNIVGTSIPDIPLYLNGEEVTDRTIEGFFFVYAPLESGVNEFTFSQEGQEDVTRKITRSTRGSGGGSSGGGGGTPSPAVTVTQVTTPRYATIRSDYVWLYPSNSQTGGSDLILVQGQRDRVIAESSNNLIKLSCGMWVSKNAVTLRNENRFTEDVLQNGVYRTGTNFDMLVWQSDFSPAVYAQYDGSTLTVHFGMHTEAPPLRLPPDLSQTIFSDVSSGINGDTPYYKFTIRDDANFEGQYTEHEEGQFRLVLKKRKTLARGEYPLVGTTILLDPGHGGEATGALGPLGHDMAEKDLNLINAVKLAERLEALGAVVHLTRDTDIDLPLEERVRISLDIKPDLFISLHINSVDETTNATNIRGFSVWHRNPNSLDLSYTILDVMHLVNPDTNRTKHINNSNFYVCRPSWTPSVLLEAGFIVNIHDFVWLIDPEKQDHMADTTVTAILEYFSG